MLSRMFSYIYQQPLDKVIQFSIVIIIEWAILMHLMKDHAKRSRTVNQCCTAAALLVILGATILDRTIGSCSQVYLQPFSSFSAERFNAELCRECMMNVFLFLPLGIFVPFTLPENKKDKVRYTVLFGLCLSMGAETLQLLFGLGWCETDDIINNTLGATLGTRAYVLFEKMPQLLNAFQRVKEPLFSLQKTILSDKNSETPHRF